MLKLIYHNSEVDVMYVLTLPVLRKMLHTAAVDLRDNVQYLCELDSVAGDGDHGIAIGHIADIL